MFCRFRLLFVCESGLMVSFSANMEPPDDSANTYPSWRPRGHEIGNARQAARTLHGSIFALTGVIPKKVDTCWLESQRHL